MGMIYHPSFRSDKTNLREIEINDLQYLKNKTYIILYIIFDYITVVLFCFVLLV